MFIINLRPPILIIVMIRSLIDFQAVLYLHSKCIRQSYKYFFIAMTLITSNNILSTVHSLRLPLFYHICSLGQIHV